MFTGNWMDISKGRKSKGESYDERIKLKEKAVKGLNMIKNFGSDLIDLADSSLKEGENTLNDDVQGEQSNGIKSKFNKVLRKAIKNVKKQLTPQKE